MKVRELLTLLEAADPEAEVLINRNLDDEWLTKINFKLAHVQRAYADDHELDYQNFDISHYSNRAACSRPVVILSDDAIENMVVVDRPDSMSMKLRPAT